MSVGRPGDSGRMRWPSILACSCLAWALLLGLRTAAAAAQGGPGDGEGDRPAETWQAWLPMVFKQARPVLSMPSVVYTPTLGSGDNWFRIAVISDIHVGEGDFDGDYGSRGWDDEAPDAANEGPIAATLRNFVHWINAVHAAERIEYVFALGDLTDSAEISELQKAKEILDLLEVPYVPLIGNHDVWPYTSHDQSPPTRFDAHFEAVFAPQYERLADEVPHFVKCPNPPLDLHAAAVQDRYFQHFAFEAGYGDWQFLCLDFASRQQALYGTVGGVWPEAELYPVNMENVASSIRVHDSDARWVVLYEHVNYGGRSEVFLADDPDLSDNLIGLDASSVQIIGDCSVTLYEATDYGPGRAVTLTSSMWNLWWYQMNDKVASLRTQNTNEGGSVTLFSERKYKGQQESFVADDRWLRGNAIGDNATASVRVSGSCWAELFDLPNFLGDRLIVREDRDSLDENGAYLWWRKQLRKDAHKGRVLIFAHHPLSWRILPPGAQAGDVQGADAVADLYLFEEQEYDDIAALLHEYRENIAGWFGGHMHRKVLLPFVPWWREAFTWRIEYDGDPICQGYFVDSFKGHLDEDGYVQLVTLRYE